MVSFHSFEPQPEPTELVLPTYITFQAATATKSVYLCAYCNTPEGIVDIIQRTVQRLGGMSVCQPLESGSSSRQLSIGAQLPGLSSSDLWKIRFSRMSSELQGKTNGCYKYSSIQTILNSWQSKHHQLIYKYHLIFFSFLDWKTNYSSAKGDNLIPSCKLS